MVSVGQVWDRTTLVLGGRGHALAAIAVPTIFLPAVVRAAFAAYATPTPVNTLIGGLIGLAVGVVTLWGHLAVIALSSDPAHLPQHAQRLASRRLLPAIGLLLLLGIVFGILLLPPIAALGSVMGPASIAAMKMGVMPAVPPGVGLFAMLYLLAFAVVALVIATRLFLVNPVIVNERLGLGAFRRSWALTRGWTWRLIGLMILYLLVLLIAAGAAHAVVGIVLRLILGVNGVATAAFFGAVAAAAVTTALGVVVATFSAQLYLARQDVLRPA